MTEIQNSKPFYDLEEGKTKSVLVTCREPLGRMIEYWNL